jgi:hypothetical protein
MKRERLTVPQDFREETTSGVRLDLPAGRSFPAEIRARVQEAVEQKLGVVDFTAVWHLAGNRPYVVFKPTPQAPAKVGFRDVAEAIAAAPDTKPVIGMAKKGEIVSLDLEDESPHILISAGSGGGKSILARILIAQFLARGARVIIFDRKRISHRWAKDIPGVEYYRDTEDIHDQLVRLAATGDTRNRLTDDEDREFQRVVIIFEEMNATTGKLVTYWASEYERLKAQAKTDGEVFDEPKRSPAITALGDLVNMGRQVSMHVVAIGQRIETRTLGGGDVRESFGIRLLSRYSVQTWKMLCGDIWPMPRKPNVRGRWQYVANGEAREVQIAYLTDAEALFLSTSQRVDQADKPVGTPEGTATSPGQLVTLMGFFGSEYDKRRKQMQRDPSAPIPVSKVDHGADLYRRVELTEWADRRDAAQTVNTEKVST